MLGVIMLAKKKYTENISKNELQKIEENKSYTILETSINTNN